MNQVFAQPVGWDRDVEHRPSFAPVIAYLVGIVAGAAAIGFLLAFSGTLLRTSAVGAAGSVALAVAAMVAGLIAEGRGSVAPLPESHRQVPRQWLAWRARWATAAAFGVMLGMCVWTLLHHAAIYVLAGCVLLLSPAAGAAIGIAYGLTRGGALLATWLAIGVRPNLHRRLTLLTLPHARVVLIVFATFAASSTVAVYFLGS